MTTRKHLDLAKNEAIYTTIGLIFSAFIVALVIAFGIPPLLSSVLSSSTTDPTKTIVTILTGLTTSVFFMWFSSDRIKTTVGLAIDAAVTQKSEEYIKQHPDVEERLRVQLQEYTCAIPVNHRSESSIRLSSPSPAICDRRIGRDAVIRSLSYNDKLLQGIALAAVDETLVKTKKPRKIAEEVRAAFLTDIYAYLKGWLMLSITHSHAMPIGYIQQRYPTSRCPDPKAYVMAIEFIKEKGVKDKIVFDAMNQIVNDGYAVTQAKNLMDEYLTILIAELRKPTT